ncbi:unnamed protein product [Tilletia controversa]|nr:unnamed protein product [Tilletia controversa]
MVQLGQLRQASGVEDDDVDDNSEVDDAEDLIYPNSYKDDAASVITRLAPSSGLQTPNGPLLRACDPRPRRLLRVRLRSERDALGSGDECGRAPGLRPGLQHASSRVPTHDAANRHVNGVQSGAGVAGADAESTAGERLGYYGVQGLLETVRVLFAQALLPSMQSDLL